MRLAISNIAWDLPNDRTVYKLMKKLGFTGLEIAPTRIIPDVPYNHISEIKEWYKNVHNEYGFRVPSMQSIWFGRAERIFGSTEEREKLVRYTKKAIDFAGAINCKNLVFGCPRNRAIPDNVDIEPATSFFGELGDYAYEHNTVIGMEPIQRIYNTNYINTTQDAIDLINGVNSKGFLLNLDLGTMIENEETFEVLRKSEKLINHVHISEPALELIKERQLHTELRDFLESVCYEKYVSIELKKDIGIKGVEDTMKYVARVFL